MSVRKPLGTSDVSSGCLCRNLEKNGQKKKDEVRRE